MTAVPHPLAVVITDANLRGFGVDLAAALPQGTDLRWLDGQPEAAVRVALADADVFVGPRFTAGMGVAAPNLRLVQVAGAGLDGIEPGAVPALGNPVQHLPPRGCDGRIRGHGGGAAAPRNSGR